MGEAIRHMDEHVPRAVAEAMRRRGVDVLTAQEAGLTGIPDVEHLAIASSRNRVVVTQDADYLRLHAAGIHHRGVAYVPQGTPLRHFIARLTVLVEVLDADDMIDHVEFL